jgi:hypothetical protein
MREKRNGQTQVNGHNNRRTAALCRAAVKRRT